MQLTEGSDSPLHPGPLDTVIRNAAVVDGSGGPRFHADVAIHRGKIHSIGVGLAGRFQQELDGAGQVLAPGFIDVHTHDDYAVISDRSNLCKISQGVTTVVTGNCGVSIAPLNIRYRPPPPLDLLSGDPDHFFATFEDYFKYLEDSPAAVNVAAQVGHSTLRVATMSDLQRPADAGEIKRMRRLLEDALRAGAIGMSTGLFYRTAQASTTQEVIDVAKGMRERGAIHTTHMRDEADAVAESLAETFRIGREADVPVIVSHHKCSGTRNFGRSIETLALIDEAARQQEVGFDVYPYCASSSVLDVEKFRDATRIVVSWSIPHPKAAGRDLAELAAEHGLSQKAMADRLQPAGGIYFMMDEVDVSRILAHPQSMIGSDGLPGDTHPHPRLWGTFPRVLGHYSRELNLFPLEAAVRKMTSLSARQFNLSNRGLVRPGYQADLVLFDPLTVKDLATFDHPVRHSAGIHLVMVNGAAVYRDGAATGAFPGQVLRRQ